jgi:hypothetical protein
MMMDRLEEGDGNLLPSEGYCESEGRCCIRTFSTEPAAPSSGEEIAVLFAVTVALPVVVVPAYSSLLSICSMFPAAAAAA